MLVSPQDVLGSFTSIDKFYIELLTIQLMSSVVKLAIKRVLFENLAYIEKQSLFLIKTLFNYTLDTHLLSNLSLDRVNSFQILLK